MPNNWKTYTLDEICNRITDGSHSSPKEVKNGSYQIATVKDMNDYGFYLEQCKRISDKDFESLKNQDCVPEKGDVLFSKDGTIGKVLLFDFDYKIGVLSSIAIFRPKEELIDSLFLSYYLKEQTNNNFIKDNFRSGSAIPRIILRDFKKYNLTVPELSEQKSIAQILSAIDDKIENNLAINKTLEEMAMALYKHWFVDFGPFQDGEFVESELGRIPKGWEVKSLDALGEFKNGKGIGSKLRHEDGKYIILGSNGIIGRTNEVLFNEPVIAIGRVGANYGEIHYSMEPCWISDNAITVQPKAKNHFWFVYQIMRKIDYSNFAIGSAQPLITQSAVKAVSFIYPDSESLDAYSFKIELLYKKLNDNIKENDTLTQLRDTLLPKLISGEVRLKEFRESITN